VLVVTVRAEGPLASLAARLGRWDVALWPEGPGRTVYRGLAGVDVDGAAGQVMLAVEGRTEGGDAAAASAAIQVRGAAFPVQRLTVPRAFAELDAATLARVARERQRMEAALGDATPRRLWADPFRLPLEAAPPGHGFGARRIVNGEARAPHTGVDFAAPAGTPVLAAQAGRVVLAEEQFFPGAAVVIDHGLGLFTMYFHLQEMRVRARDPVRAGQPVGTVGASGRATGAHLHWGARLGGARIDGAALVRTTTTAEPGRRDAAERRDAE
jgi:murein DD-endopeptidase MepM/ murein hydrolase activator NlpD